MVKVLFLKFPRLRLEILDKALYMKIKLIIGLGNPGKEYAKTYHNVGFLFVDFLSAMSLRGTKRRSNPINKRVASSRWPSAFAMTPLLTLLKSNVYMNQSGRFVKNTLKTLRCKPEELLIVHDDSDIKLGEYKISFDRGTAGHKGAESIIEALGTKKIWRLRIGVRKNTKLRELEHESARTREKASEFVLKKISRVNQKIMENIFQEAIRTLKNNFEI